MGQQLPAAAASMLSCGSATCLFSLHDLMACAVCEANARRGGACLSRKPSIIRRGPHRGSSSSSGSKSGWQKCSQEALMNTLQCDSSRVMSMIQVATAGAAAAHYKSKELEAMLKLEHRGSGGAPVTGKKFLEEKEDVHQSSSCACQAGYEWEVGANKQYAGNRRTEISVQYCNAPTINTISSYVTDPSNSSSRSSQSGRSRNSSQSGRSSSSSNQNDCSSSIRGSFTNAYFSTSASEERRGKEQDKASPNTNSRRGSSCSKES